MVEISELTDDLLGRILKRVNDPDDRKRVSEVCKLWFTLEGLTRRSLTLLRLSFLRQVLPRFPNLVTFQTSQLIEEEADLEFIAQTCPKLEDIDLSTTEFLSMFFPTNGLYGLSSGGGLPKLSKVSFSGIRLVSIERWLHKLAHEKLTYLDLGLCRVVDDDAVEAIGRLCTRLSYLNLKYAEISDNGLTLLAQGCSNTLKTLVLAQCYDITDSGFCHLQNMQCLEELDLEGCGYRTGVTDSGIIGLIAAISEILDLSGSYVTGAGVRAFSGHRCLQSLDLRMCHEFRLSDIEHMVLGCQSLKSIVLPNIIKETIPESLSRIVKFADEPWA
ncbi:hypothetical protein ACLB2K_017553 [Fragaria x ananassa]